MATARPSPPAPPPPPRPAIPASEAARRLAHAPGSRLDGDDARLDRNKDSKFGAGEEVGADAAQAPVPVASDSEPLYTEEEMPAIDGPVARLPVELDVVVPVREFRVRHLLALEPGELIESQWSYGEDVPIAAGDVQLAWSEFEVLDNQIAVRITRLP